MLNDEQHSAAALRRSVKASNGLIAQIGYMSARYMTPAEISATLDGRLTPAEIEAAWERFEFGRPVLAPGHDLLDVFLSAKHRTKLAAEARERGMEMPALAAALLATTARDGLVAAVLDRC